MDFPGMLSKMSHHGPTSARGSALPAGLPGEISEVHSSIIIDLGDYPGDLVGQIGLEQAFEDVLRGQPGLRRGGGRCRWA